MNNCCTLEEKIKYICEYEYKYFFNKANVIAVGLGYKVSNGFNTFKKCIKVLVGNKLPENNLNLNDIIPVCYKGLETDVVESGYLRSIKLTKRIRPVLGGYCIGPAAKIGGGSMGCVVTDNHDNYILSCNHVLVGDNEVPIGSPILQPSIFDGGKSPKDIVGSLSEFVPIKAGGENYVDCAMARILNNKNVSPSIALVGNPRGVVKAKLHEDVKKVGKTTELTTGKVTIVNATAKIQIQGKETVFKDQIGTTRMSDAGDSGSVLLNQHNYVLGLAVFDGEGITVYNSFQRVLNSMHVLLVTH
ncbi:trypsin-like serine protease [Clostridium botulinum]|uniref:Peptidase S1 domain-containing protein n=1 Tax=Clostridium botulinum TaxID=1491 RepID=A0A9Q1ZBW3_CLOBO|nr:trypsin-like serine protease [Clostridium botulinum]KEH98757.1 hypothetical protein Z953_12545 [Clostridium botulinum D str. 16868]KEI03134.1 hypothetical protein Y848_05325 [Clostridium botulinum C/D str. Sp77]KLU76341.1 hypothetical protein CBC3_04260 [Clostridium botulinum V891]KOA75023.1 hypothetical protein ADU78_09465 [Clostridium botulinum]KOA79187.1 hypothetical protein ADU77_04680 [Clostridium botulinum]